MDKFELIFATDFVLDMMRLCKQHKLPKKPELKTFRKVFAFWISTLHPQRYKYTSLLEEVMVREWPHFATAADKDHVETKPWEKN